MKTFDVFKRDSLLLDYLRKHKGEENCVSSSEIQQFLSERGYSVKIRNVGTLVNKIMYDRNAPICYVNGKGYYWACRREEIEKTVQDMEKRRCSLSQHIEHLMNFIID